MERLTDFILELPAFQAWTRNRVRKLLMLMRYEKVIKGWEFPNLKFENSVQNKLCIIIDGEFTF